MKETVMPMKRNNMLYHYTSFDTLALILSNRNICFNSLTNVDDMEEAETADMPNFGKHVFVSCWTDDAQESIALWNLYTPNMHGVRIGLPTFPFKKHHFQKGQFFLKDDIDTYIDIAKEFSENKGSIVPNYPHLIQVQYSNEHDLLFPKVKTSEPNNAAELFMEAKDMQELSHKCPNLTLHYSFEKLGRYKRTDWSFQREWRYLLMISPMGLQDSNPPSFEKQQELIRRYENPMAKAPYQRFFLELDNQAVEQMEIILGPRISEAEKIYVKSLLKDHGLENNWRDSALRIR